MAEPEMFTTEWRALRVRQGDAALRMATHPSSHQDVQVAANLIAIAQAHYQAANIRSRPGEGGRERARRPYPDRILENL